MLKDAFSMQRFLPAQDLQFFIKDFVIIVDARPLDTPPERLLPDGNYMMILNLEHGYLTENAGSVYVAEKSAIGYLHTHTQGAFYLRKTGTYRGIAIHFTPEGMYHLLRMSLDELPMNAIFTTEELFHQWGIAFAEQLCDLATPQEQIALLEQLLRQKFGKMVSIDESITHMLQWIETIKGKTSVTALATQFNFNRKTLERRFQQRVGISPKQYLRTVRFQNAYTQLCLGKYEAMMDLVVENGYFDQMHMIKEFKQFIGFTPSALLKTSDFYKQLYRNQYRILEQQDSDTLLFSNSNF